MLGFKQQRSHNPGAQIKFVHVSSHTTCPIFVQSSIQHPNSIQHAPSLCLRIHLHHHRLHHHSFLCPCLIIPAWILPIPASIPLHHWPALSPTPAPVPPTLLPLVFPHIIPIPSHALLIALFIPHATAPLHPPLGHRHFPLLKLPFLKLYWGGCRLGLHRLGPLSSSSIRGAAPPPEPKRLPAGPPVGWPPTPAVGWPTLGWAGAAPAC